MVGTANFPRTDSHPLCQDNPTTMTASSLARLHPSLSLVFCALLSACATVPETGRSQLLLISTHEEVGLGLSQFDELKKNTPISKDPAMNALVQRVGRRVAGVASLPGAQWEFVLFDKPDTANAFCLPGGKVGIYSGLLPITKDEAGLATVMSHEVAHAVARHGAERLSEGLMVQLGGEVLSAAMSTRPEATQSLIVGAYGIGSQVGVMLPHSRAQELEADHIGLLYMARAGYDPHEAVTFWKRFSAYNREHGSKPIAFLSTHPLDDRRIAQIESLMPQAEAEYRKSPARH
jgi:predicted Zn-dependent protease